MAQITSGTHVFIGFGTQADAGVLRTVRRPDGTWTPLESILDTGAGFAAPAVAAATWPPWEQHILAVNGGTPFHAMENTSLPRTPFGNVETQAGNVSDLVAIATDGWLPFPDGDVSHIAEIQVCGVTNDFRLWHTLRHRPGGAWSGFGDVEGQAGDPGAVTDVDCAYAEGLHVCAVTSDGRLWHTIRRDDGSWLSFGNVEGQAGERGTFEQVACTGGLQLVGMTADRRLWHTVRDAGSGTWTTFKPLPPVPGFNPVTSIGCNDDGAGLQVCAAMLDVIWHTLLPTDGSAWTTWGNVGAQVGQPNLGARHIDMSGRSVSM